MRVTADKNDYDPTDNKYVPRSLVPQETYKPARRHGEFAGSNAIKLVVDGVEGIRLSDASEGNWVGFEGRDDRTLFKGDRSQVMVRLHVRRSVSEHHRFCGLILPSSSS